MICREDKTILGILALVLTLNTDAANCQYFDLSWYQIKIFQSLLVDFKIF